MRHFRRLNLEAVQLLSVLILTGVPYLVWMGQSYALELENRSIALSTATPSAPAVHTFQMTINSSQPIGSIVFQYCSNSPSFMLPCVAPSGLDLRGAVLAQQTGNTGFSIDNADSSASELVIGRTLAPAAQVASTYVFTNIVNPALNNQTTFVRISTYASSDGSGSYIDNGAVAFSTESNYSVGAYIPPVLNICVGVTVADDCSEAAGNSLDFGVLNPTSTGRVTSQFAAATNNVSGYNVYILGDTMTSGNNIIPPLTTPSISRTGQSEFGVNLRKNTNPDVGIDPDGVGSGVPLTGYNSPNLFNFSSGDPIAASNYSTWYERMTVSYVVNVSPSQPAGVYSTTLTYLMAPQF